MNTGASAQAGGGLSPATHGLPPEDLARLTNWLAGQGVRVDGELSARLIAGGKSNLTYELRDGEHRWVLRRPPLGGHTPSAHDVAREFRVTSALEATSVPVASPIAASEDPSVIGAPFTIVQFVEGTVVQTAHDLDVFDDQTVDAAIDSLLNTLAALHGVDPAAVGLDGFGRADGYAARQLRRWSGQWQLVGGHASSETSGAAAEVVGRLGGRIPEQGRSRVVHGDYRIDNTLLDPETARVAAVVDWELSTLGEPVADVALMCVYREPALDSILGFPAAWTSERIPPADGLANRYERAGGVPLADWDFWMALSSYKLAVIAAGIDQRWRAGGTVGEGFATAGRAVPPLMAQALEYSGRVRASG